MYKLFLKIYARRIAEQAYQGILGRPGDEVGLAQYSRELSRFGRLDKVLADLVGSQEAVDKSFTRHAEPLLRVAFAAALGREPSPEEVALHAPDITTLSGLQNLLDALLKQRGRTGVWQPADADELVRAVFLGLLSREPDEEARLAYQHSFLGDPDVSALIADVAQSQEHWNMLVGRHAEALVQVVFQALLQRVADPEALDAYARRLAETRDLHALIDEVGSSREHRNQLLRRLSPTERPRA